MFALSVISSIRRNVALGTGLLLAAFCVLALTADARAALSLETVGTFNAPRDMRSHPDDPDRLYVVEKAGTIQTIKNGTKTQVINLNSGTALVGSVGNEEGLLSLALAPDFASSGKFYVYYTTPNTSGNNNSIQVDEYVMTDNVSTVATRRPILTIAHPNNTNHNGGQIHFGPDGFLYISMGDGGGSGDPLANGQNPTTLPGTLMRINPNESGGQPYTSPSTNPYFGTANDPSPNTRDEIWSWGLRNPWRWSFDSETGDLTLADVGQDVREEINFRTGTNPGRGDNFGWNCREGSVTYSGAPSGCATSPFAGTWVSPVWDYANLAQGQGSCSITGGYVSHDESTPELLGRYVYGDYCSAVVRSIQLGTPTATGDRVESISVAANSLVSFGEDSCGRLYVVSDPNGTADPIRRIIGDTPADCDDGEPPVDSTPPTVSHTLSPASPNGGAGWYTSAPTMTLTATDEEGGSGVDTVTWQVDSTPPTVYTQAVPLNLADGAHTVTYKATDVAGNESTVGSFTFSIDQTKPSSSVQAVNLTGTDCPNLATAGFCPVRVTMTGTDPGSGSGINSRYLSIVPSGQGPPAIAELYTQPIDITTPGDFDIHYFAHDNAGNTEELKTMSVSVPAIIPTVALLGVKTLKKSNPVATIGCPALAEEACSVTFPAKVKVTVAAKGTKKQKKAAKKAAKKSFKVKGPKTIQPGATGRLTVDVTKSQCNAMRPKKMKIGFKVQITVAAPGGATVTNTATVKGAVCGKTSHF